MLNDDGGCKLYNVHYILAVLSYYTENTVECIYAHSVSALTFYGFSRFPL